MHTRPMIDDGTGDTGLLYLLGDHLGSTTVAANPDGTLNSKQLYMPFGESRYTSGSLPTDYKFTGQMEEPELGLYYYNARYYDPSLGRFISADTIIPQPGNPIAFDRYAYVNNNPIRYTDSTGHCVDGSITRYLCIAMAAGALASYAIQVGENRKAGMDWGEALTTDISGERIVEGALLAGGVIVGAAAVSAGVGAIGTTANAACSDGDCTNEVGIAGQGSSSIWNMNPLERGVVIENILGRSPFLPQNFPVIDRWENGIATSYKSIDLAAKTYQDLAALSYKVQNYVTTLANWTGTNWGGITITSSEIIGRELILAIPPNASQAQLFVLKQLQVWAQDQGVILIINIIE